MKKNLWGVHVAAQVTDDPWETVPEEFYQLTRKPELAPDERVMMVAAPVGA